IREQGAGSREQGAGSREQEAGSRKQEAGSRHNNGCFLRLTNSFSTQIYVHISYRATLAPYNFTYIIFDELIVMIFCKF
ncbi:MAG: hypothetical protein WBA17_09390, partial [Saprospiraceae bacterium]